MLLSDYIRRLQLKLDVHGDRELTGVTVPGEQTQSPHAVDSTSPNQRQVRRLAAYRDIQNIERHLIPAFEQCVD